jgi:hypothetical protein
MIMIRVLGLRRTMAKYVSAPSTAASSGFSTLSATLRLCLRSRAKYTVAQLALEAGAAGEGGCEAVHHGGKIASTA